MNNKISEIKNTLEGITSRLDEAEDQISELQDKVEKKHPDRARKGKETQKEQTCGRELQDNMKHRNTCITGTPEEKKRSK